MVRQKEYEMIVGANPIKLIFKEGIEQKSLKELNDSGKRLVLVFETKDSVQELNRKIAVFEWEENSK